MRYALSIADKEPTIAIERSRLSGPKRKSSINSVVADVGRPNNEVEPSRDIYAALR
jgi:hypothetical protein